MKTFTPEEIRSFIQIYEKAAQHLKNAVEELRQLNDKLTELNGGETHYIEPFETRGGGLLYRLNREYFVKYQKNLEIGCWNILLSQLELTSCTTCEDIEKIRKDIAKGKFGTFSEENLVVILDNLKSQQEIFVYNMAKEVFRYFSPNYHQKTPIPKKIISGCGHYNAIEFASCYTGKWEMLGKVLLLLDNQKIPENRFDRLEELMSATVKSGKMEFECQYFKARFYEKSCTAHLTFTRMDLIETINKIALAE